jgi:hypothetical protein
MMMKAKYFILIIIIGIVGLGVFFSIEVAFSRSYFHFNTFSTDLSQENMKGLRLYDDLTSPLINSNFGGIDRTHQSRDVEEYDYYFLSKNLEIASKHGEITRFIVSEKEIKTEKGIGIHNNKDEVINTYGKNYYKRSEQGLDIIGYVDKKTKTSIEFWLVDDKVAFFRWDITSME